MQEQPRIPNGWGEGKAGALLLLGMVRWLQGGCSGCVFWLDERGLLHALGTIKLALAPLRGRSGEKDELQLLWLVGGQGLGSVER